MDKQINDSIVAALIEKHEKRAEKGLVKYGVTLDREELDVEQWLVHLQEELMDGALYIERLLTAMRNWHA